MSMSHATRSLPARRPLALAVSLAVLASPALAADKVLDEVQVTAAGEAPATEGYQAFSSRSSTKTDTLLRDTPQSVSVVTSQQIKDQAVQSMAEAVRYTPGVTFAQGEGNRDAAVIRGSISTGDFYLDGVRDDVQYYRDVYNIDRIEVLKGANGLAFGRGGSGGVINRVSKEANWSPIRQISASVGSFHHKRLAADVGGALNETVAGRINLVTEDSESFRDGVSLRRNGISPTLTIKPSDKTKIVLSAEHFNDLRVTDRGVPSRNGKPFKSDETRFYGNAEQSPTETTVQALGATIEHRFDNGLKLTNKTRFADYDKYYQNVYANGPVTNAGTVALAGYLDDTQRQNLFNQTDLLVPFKTGRVSHELVLGTEFGRQQSENFRINASGLAAQPVKKPFDIATFGTTKSRNSETTVDVSAVYLQNQITFTPNWQAVIGVREDRFKTDFTDKLNAANSGKVVDAKLSPRAALIYKPVKDVSIYASYSQTFVPRAGDQLSSLSAANQGFDPEEFINKEVGVKWDARPDLSLSAALYRLDRNNVLVTDPLVVTQATLVDGQEVKGAEFEVSGKLTDRWSVLGGYAFADSEITRSQTTAIRAGNETAQTPRHTFSLWNRYDLNDRFGLGLGVISRSEMYALDSNVVTLPGYARVDAAAYYKASKSLDLQLNIENLTDRDYFVNAHNDNNITPGSPIAARLSATYTF
ncbi:TonB-dependent receptor [Perlucidibaca piscinae]|uniref:TonB-dependent receptor n=1 Tax=Perlucidibaca piscinae TaxID=392589 RepID=UPI0003B6470B|nr:TonB-dependent siderophore receptor [Perlucidibaca piscinae]